MTGPYKACDSPSLTVYAHLIKTDDHAGNMAALGAMATLATPQSYGGNVVPLHG